MERDVNYEQANKTKSGDIKCKNWNFCKEGLPLWWYDCKGHYFCIECDMRRLEDNRADRSNVQTNLGISNSATVSCTPGVAKTPDGPVQAETFNAAEQNVNLTCYDCNSQLYFRTGHTRMVCGVSVPVRACFCHSPRVGNLEHTGCNGESALHLAAKHKIQMNPTMQFATECSTCKTLVLIGVNPAPDCTRVMLEFAFQRYRLDVAFVDTQTNEVVGCVEVFVSHRVDNDKVRALTSANLPWCEVDANHVLNAQVGNPLTVIGCGLPHFVCASCRDRAQQEKHEREVQARALAISQFNQNFETWKELFKTLQAKVDEEKRVIMTRLVQLIGDEKLMFLKTSDTSTEGDTEFFPEPKRMRTEVSQEQIQAVVESISQPELIIPFGKYAGSTLQNVLRIDFGYIVWLAGFERTRENGKSRPTCARVQHTNVRLRSLARKAIEGYCFRCGDAIQGPSWRTWCRDCYSNPV